MFNKKHLVFKLICVVFIATLLFAQTHTSAVLDVAQTWTAIQTFSSGASTVLLNSGTSRTVSAPYEIVICTSTCTVTPQVPVAGYQLCVFNGDNVATVITLAALGSSARYENTARTAYGTSGTGTLVSGGAVKDSVCIVGLDSTHYITTNSNGTWTAS